MEEVQKLNNVTTCSACIKTTPTMPEDCQIDAGSIAHMVAQSLPSDAIRQLCRGCPLQSRLDTGPPSNLL